MAAESFKDLPDECWELIFDRLLQLHHSHLESLSLSCKRFLSITNNLRTHFEITVPTLIPLSRLFKRFPHLNSLHFRTSRRGNDLDRVVIDVATNSNLNLETLKFSGTELPLEGFKLLGSRMKSLKVLTVGNLAALRDIDLVVIADSMPSLEDLDISFPVNDFGASAGNGILALRRSEKGVTDLGIEVLSSKLKGLRMIDLSGNKFLTHKSLLALSSNCVNLEVIILLECSLVTAYGIEFVLRNCTNLSELSVTEIDFRRVDDYSIRCARNLSDLVIYDSVVTDEYLQLVANAGIPLKCFTLYKPMSLCFTFSGISALLNKYRSLRFLSLAEIDFLTDEKMSDLSLCLSALNTLWLDSCKYLTESTFFTLAKNCPLLEDIRMRGTNLGGGRDSGTDVVKNPRIKFLNLEDSQNLSDECLAKLGSLCPSLDMLEVSYCKGITERGIADFLKCCSKIRNLQIDDCGGIKNIGKGFELSELDFLLAARSGINDDGLAVIGNRCPGLLHLYLDGCLEVTTVGLKEILTNCERLRKLTLTGCLNVSTETIDEMMLSRPSLRKIILSCS